MDTMYTLMREEMHTKKVAQLPHQEVESIARFYCSQDGEGCKETTDTIAYQRQGGTNL